MTAKFRTWLADNLPTWASGDTAAARLGKVQGLVVDIMSDLAVTAVRARSLYAIEFPLDALHLVGSERNMPRYAIETDQGYRARLTAAWAAWLQAGTKAAVATQLAAFGVSAVVKELRDWNWDGDTTDWSRFWVIVDNHGLSQWKLGNTHRLGEPGLTWGSTGSPDYIASLRSIVRHWKAGHVRCAYLIFVFDHAAITPDGTWGDPAQRDPRAAYIPG